MKRSWIAGVFAALLLCFCQVTVAQSHRGFDRNGYPGDVNLDSLRQTFEYASFWLNAPPGEQTNSWAGKRSLLKQHGFGFVVLFNGRLYASLKGKDAVALGTEDGELAVANAAKEGFGKGVLIFLDQEEGGRLLPEQVAYIFAWFKAVLAGGDRVGIYCSGIDVADGPGRTIDTARDVMERARRAKEKVALWVANDACPPAPGCARTEKPPSASGVQEAMIWQYAQSPRRKQFSAACPKNAAPDGNCYAPGMAHSAETFVDLDVSGSADPSEER